MPRPSTREEAPRDDRRIDVPPVPDERHVPAHRRRPGIDDLAADVQSPPLDPDARRRLQPAGGPVGADGGGDPLSAADAAAPPLRAALEGHLAAGDRAPALAEACDRPGN